MKHPKKLGIVIACILVVLVVVVAIARILPAAKSGPHGLSVGLLLPLTGEAQSYGEDGLKAAQAAVLGTGVALDLEDEKCDANATLSAFQKLTELDHDAIVVGPLCGSPQEALAPVVKDDRVPVILPAAAPDDLFAQSGGAMFNIQYSIEDEGAAVARRMIADGENKVVIIGYQNAFSEGEVAGFTKAYTGTIVDQISFADSNDPVETELAKLKGKDFDAVFSPDSSFLFAKGISMLHRYGLNQQVYSIYPTEGPSARPLAEGVIYSFPGGMTGTQGATYDLTYDAVTKAIALLKTCGNDKACILKTLQSDPSFDGNGTSTRPIIFKQVKNGQPVLLP